MDSHRPVARVKLWHFKFLQTTDTCMSTFLISCFRGNKTGYFNEIAVCVVTEPDKQNRIYSKPNKAVFMPNPNQTKSTAFNSKYKNVTHTWRWPFHHCSATCSTRPAHFILLSLTWSDGSVWKGCSSCTLCKQHFQYDKHDYAFENTSLKIHRESDKCKGIRGWTLSLSSLSGQATAWAWQHQLQNRHCRETITFIDQSNGLTTGEKWWQRKKERSPMCHCGGDRRIILLFFTHNFRMFKNNSISWLL